jgi:hypothetical protein
MRILSIDPGKQGALAVMNGRKLLAVHRTPVVGKEYDREAMLKLLTVIGMPSSKYGAPVFIIETATPMPGQGAQSTWANGFGHGLWWGLATSLALPIYPVAPATWKKAMGLSNPRKKDAPKPTTKEKKDAAIAMAIRLSPGVPELRHDGCAEAYLIGLYAWEFIFMKEKA